MKWYATRGSMGQGLVIEDKTGRNVAVSYDEKDTDLLASAPELLAALEWIIDRIDRGGKAAKSDAVSVARAAIRKANGEG